MKGKNKAPENKIFAKIRMDDRVSVTVLTEDYVGEK